MLPGPAGCDAFSLSRQVGQFHLKILHLEVPPWRVIKHFYFSFICVGSFVLLDFLIIICSLYFLPGIITLYYFLELQLFSKLKQNGFSFTTT